MFRKKTKNEEKEGMGALGALFTSLLLAPILTRVEDFLFNVLSSVKETTNDYFKGLAQAVVLLMAAFAGVVFILVGVAQYLSVIYKTPGVGELIVGGMILLVTLVWYTLPSKRK